MRNQEYTFFLRSVFAEASAGKLERVRIDGIHIRHD